MGKGVLMDCDIYASAVTSRPGLFYRILGFGGPQRSQACLPPPSSPSAAPVTAGLSASGPARPVLRNSTPLNSRLLLTLQDPDQMASASSGFSQLPSRSPLPDLWLSLHRSPGIGTSLLHPSVSPVGLRAPQGSNILLTFIFSALF